ncbi:hypothetical protein L2E82_04455 [Cichorium intybus]|uniref:Uncharacterized protein n=1 Tax=Cichorium intybus TaxID=13427 RepID=A0ACB9H7P4_CICIN|nr:hypothetical protein L2E82_04455 [Cichorium intybus]
MSYGKIGIPNAGENSSSFYAQIPQAILAKVPLMNTVVDVYRSTLIMPYPVHNLAAEVQPEVPIKQKGKKKTTGGPSGAKVTKKRKASEQAQPKRSQPKRTKKQMVVEESSDLDRTLSQDIQAEEEEHRSSLIHETRIPSPPPTTAPLTSTITSEPISSAPQTSEAIPSEPMTSEPIHFEPLTTSTPLTTTIQTTSSDVPPLSTTS